jgi:hypothetical protein
MDQTAEVNSSGEQAAVPDLSISTEGDSAASVALAALSLDSADQLPPPPLCVPVLSDAQRRAVREAAIPQRFINGCFQDMAEVRQAL